MGTQTDKAEGVFHMVTTRHGIHGNNCLTAFGIPPAPLAFGLQAQSRGWLVYKVVCVKGGLSKSWFVLNLFGVKSDLCKSWLV